jgi:hypothetical protein
MYWVKSNSMSIQTGASRRGRVRAGHVILDSQFQIEGCRLRVDAMAERFRDSIKAAQYVSQGLMHDYPDAVVEAYRLGRNKSRQSSCTTKELERVLIDMCKGMYSVSVDYHPANAYGFVAEVSENGASDTNGTVPGRIFVLVSKVKGRPIAVGSRLSGRPLVDLT